MKQSLLFIACFILLFSCSPAAAGGLKDYYVSVKAGVSFMEFDDAGFDSAVGGDQTWKYDTSTSDEVAGAGIGIGANLTDAVRLELEYFYRTRFDYDKNPTNDGIANTHQEVDIQTVMVSLFYEFTNQTPFTPYLFGSIGMAYYEADMNSRLIVAPYYTYSGSSDDINFAWNLGLGVEYVLTEKTSMDLSYRYFSLGETEWKGFRNDGGDTGSSKADMAADEILISLRYHF